MPAERYVSGLLGDLQGIDPEDASLAVQYAVFCAIEKNPGVTQVVLACDQAGHETLIEIAAAVAEASQAEDAEVKISYRTIPLGNPEKGPLLEKGMTILDSANELVVLGGGLFHLAAANTFAEWGGQVTWFSEITTTS